MYNLTDLISSTQFEDLGEIDVNWLANINTGKPFTEETLNDINDSVTCVISSPFKLILFEPINSNCYSNLFKDSNMSSTSWSSSLETPVHKLSKIMSSDKTFLSDSIIDKSESSILGSTSILRCKKRPIRKIQRKVLFSSPIASIMQIQDLKNVPTTDTVSDLASPSKISQNKATENESVLTGNNGFLENGSSHVNIVEESVSLDIKLQLSSTMDNTNGTLSHTDYTMNNTQDDCTDTSYISMAQSEMSKHSNDNSLLKSILKSTSTDGILFNNDHTNISADDIHENALSGSNIKSSSDGKFRHSSPIVYKNKMPGKVETYNGTIKSFNQFTKNDKNDIYSGSPINKKNKHIDKSQNKSNTTPILYDDYLGKSHCVPSISISPISNDKQGDSLVRASRCNDELSVFFLSPIVKKRRIFSERKKKSSGTRSNEVGPDRYKNGFLECSESDDVLKMRNNEDSTIRNSLNDVPDVKKDSLEVFDELNISNETSEKKIENLIQSAVLIDNGEGENVIASKKTDRTEGLVQQHQFENFCTESNKLVVSQLGLNKKNKIDIKVDLVENLPQLSDAKDDSNYNSSFTPDRKFIQLNPTNGASAHRNNFFTSTPLRKDPSKFRKRKSSRTSVMRNSQSHKISANEIDNCYIESQTFTSQSYQSYLSQTNAKNIDKEKIKSILARKGSFVYPTSEQLQSLCENETTYSTTIIKEQDQSCHRSYFTLTSLNSSSTSILNDGNTNLNNTETIKEQSRDVIIEQSSLAFSKSSLQEKQDNSLSLNRSLDIDRSRQNIDHKSHLNGITFCNKSDNAANAFNLNLACSNQVNIEKYSLNSTSVSNKSTNAVNAFNSNLRYSSHSNIEKSFSNKTETFFNENSKSFKKPRSYKNNNGISKNEKIEFSNTQLAEIEKSYILLLEQGDINFTQYNESQNSSLLGIQKCKNDSTNVVHMSENALSGISTNILYPETTNLTTCLFKTATGRKINLAENSLYYAKSLFSDKIILSDNEVGLIKLNKTENIRNSKEETSMHESYTDDLNKTESSNLITSNCKTNSKTNAVLDSHGSVEVPFDVSYDQKKIYLVVPLSLPKTVFLLMPI